MADITIDITKLDSAIGKLDTLISVVDAKRRSAMSDTPIALPSLADDTLGKTTTWLTDQRPELVTRLDLAKLLDVDGDGQATYKVEHGDQLWEVKNALGDELTNQLENIDINSVEGRQRAALLATLLNNYQNDPDVSLQVMNGLGPEGLNAVLTKLRELTGVDGNRYWEETGDPTAELQALTDLQESMGTGLAGMFSTASDRLPAEFGTKVAQDPWAASVLLRYLEKGNRDLNPAVFEAMGLELKYIEDNNPALWSELFRSPDQARFGHQDLQGLNPMREYLGVADNSTRAAQAVMGNNELLKYFTSERKDGDGLSEQSGKVLGVATIDAARSGNELYARHAADISSNLLFQLGDRDTKPLAGIEEEVAGIIATYIADSDRVIDESSDSEPGIHEWGKSPYNYAVGIGPESGLPKYGINLSKEALGDVLTDIGGNDAARSIIGKAATIYNAGRMDYGAAHYVAEGDGSMQEVAGESAATTGFLTDRLARGSINYEQDQAGERRKVAELFTLPLDLIKVEKIPVIGKVPLVGDLIMGEIKDGIVEGYTADKTPEVVAERNSDKDASVTLTELQALYSMEKYGQPTGADWPRDHNGALVPPGQLTSTQVRGIISEADNNSGPASGIIFQIETAWGTQVPANDQ